jgi:fumarylpyruvate hydrolase
MTEYVIPAPQQASVAVAGDTARFPVRRVYCVGRNYAAHAREMGKDPDREPPFFFQKPSDAVIDDKVDIAYPPETANFHYEMELVVAIAKEGFDVSVEQALDLVYGYAPGIDLTRRDLQLTARDAGRPWDWGKGFDRSAPCAPLHKVSEVGHPAKGRIWLSVNGEVKQDADLADLIWPVADCISIISRSMVLKPGDVIFTGTPAGVGPIQRGDTVEGGIDSLGGVKIKVV